MVRESSADRGCGAIGSGLGITTQLRRGRAELGTEPGRRRLGQQRDGGGPGREGEQRLHPADPVGGRAVLLVHDGHVAAGTS